MGPHGTLLFGSAHPLKGGVASLPGEGTEAQRGWEACQGQEPVVNADLAPPCAKRLPSGHSAGPGLALLRTQMDAKTGDRFPHVGTVFSSDHALLVAFSSFYSFHFFPQRSFITLKTENKRCLLPVRAGDQDQPSQSSLEKLGASSFNLFKA